MAEVGIEKNIRIPKSIGKFFFHFFVLFAKKS